MKMKVKFYATLRQIVGSKLVESRLEPGDTVRSMLTRLVEQFPALGPQVWDEGGQLASHVHVFVNGRELKYLPDKLDTPLRDNDSLDIFPPVAGG